MNKHAAFKEIIV